jgi:hypothetical protein
MAQVSITIAPNQCHLLVFRPESLAAPELDRPVFVAKSLGIPVEICGEAFVDTHSLEALTELIGPPRVDRQCKIPLVCGGYLEEQIWMAARCLLAFGYDVHLLREFVFARNPDHSDIHDNRLIHAGAISTTLQQLLYEWHASVADKSVRIKIQSLLTVTS